MDCKEADKLIMKYMDGDITFNEHRLLTDHIDACECCGLDFAAYVRISAEFAQMEFSAHKLIEAPEGFTASVMARVCLLPAYTGQKDGRFENAFCWVFGMVAVASGVVAVLYYGGGSLISVCSETPALTGVAGSLSETVHWLNTGILNSVELLNAAMAQVLSSADSLRFILIAVLSVAAAVQFALGRRNKVGMNEKAG